MSRGLNLIWLVSLKIVIHFSRFKPALSLNRFLVDLRRGLNSLNSNTVHFLGGDKLMLDFWHHKNPGYFSTIPAYENIKLFNHYTFLLVSISLNQRKCGKWYFFHLLLIRSEIQNILIFPIHTKQCKNNTRQNFSS